MRRKLAAGNWKMNGISANLTEVQTLIDTYLSGLDDTQTDVVICPPAPLIDRMRHMIGGAALSVGAQTCHAAPNGAHTGDVSVEILADAGAAYVIVGHSERRTDHGETNAAIQAQAKAVIDGGLVPVICIGETLDERETGATLAIIADQLAHSVPDTDAAAQIVIAYEPVWAIGTGRTPSLDQIAEVHDFIRKKLNDRFGAEPGNAMRVLYGGSVKPGNADDIFAVSNVDGALVGGASLKAEDFGAIIRALHKA
jgi:triosephosphate isomerase